MNHSISVIIPVGQREDRLSALISELVALPCVSEVIVSSGGNAGIDKNLCGNKKVRIIQVGELRRALQLNAGAAAAKGNLFLFLHADTVLPKESTHALQRLAGSLKLPEAILFFSLRFLNDGPKAVYLNQLFARFRSEVLKLPFGDQGFLLRRELFERIGGFPNEKGEDHMFIWRAFAMGVPVRCIGTPIFTSARRYREEGYLKTTLYHVALSIFQVGKGLIGMLKSRANY